MELLMVHPRQNTPLQQLADADFQALEGHFRLVSMAEGALLHHPGDPIRKVFFPVSAVVAFSRELENGLSVDTALVDREGIVGLMGLFGGKSLHAVRVLTSGFAYEVGIDELLRVFRASEGVQRMCMQAGQRIVNSVSTEAACIQLHSAPERLARWLLMRQDHAGHATLRTTHQVLAHAMGLRREAVTLLLRRLGGIRLGRGCIEVVDRQALLSCSCACYAALRSPS